MPAVLGSFDAAEMSWLVGCAPLDGGGFDAATDLIEGDTVALPAQQVASTRLRSSNSHCCKSLPSSSSRSKAENDTGGVSGTGAAQWMRDIVKIGLSASPALIPARASPFSEICKG
jgi:hypothetical protein